eukprot:c19541_g1_i1 orf=466-735(+)
MARNSRKSPKKGSAEERRETAPSRTNPSRKTQPNTLCRSPTGKKTAKTLFSAENAAVEEGHTIALATPGSDTMKECTEKTHTHKRERER